MNEEIEKKETNLLLSIIIPVYNGVSFVRNIVSDIVEHNLDIAGAYEVLLIDDGSKDKSSIICSEMSETMDCIRYFRKENGGIASARNYGLSFAQGKYITFADQDDSILHGYRMFLDRCEEEDLDMLITSPYSREVKSNNRKKRLFQDETVTDKQQINKIAGKLIDGKYLSDETSQFVSTSVWNVIYKKDMLQVNNIRFKVFIDYEDDWIFNIETLLVSKKIGISSAGYYCWIIRQDSESHRPKYIDGLLEKRRNWMDWMYVIMRSMDIDNKRQEEYVENVLCPRNIMMCFNNACFKPNSRIKDIISEIVDACMEWRIKEIHPSKIEEMDRRNRYLFGLLKQKRIKSAIVLNRIIVRNRFH